MTARAAERAGADFVLALNAGRFRAMGGASPASILPIRNSNEFVASFGRTEILPSTKLPVFFGTCTFDPELDVDRWLDRIIKWGFGGVTNFPSVIHIDDERRSLLEKCGLGYSREIELLVKAAKRGLMTIAYTRSQSEARRMVEAGAEAICINFNLNRAVESGADPSVSLSELAARTSAVARVAQSVNKSTICLLGGGPITKPDELLDICRETRNPRFHRRLFAGPRASGDVGPRGDVGLQDHPPVAREGGSARTAAAVEWFQARRDRTVLGNEAHP
ncbi:phosphoenolpyruvate hydrolase family protein [Bradyrhizobium ottawaense]|uniref:phosphoenolpyruvate hydrolase family protein n=1 Tax=Bradyrhizobium ottawaense TaxID=931866 RepID=UPI00384BE4D0